MKKKILCFLLSLCMVVTLTPAVAFAGNSDNEKDTNIEKSLDASVINKVKTFASPSALKRANAEASAAVISVNGKNYTDLQTAINEAATGSTIKILNPIVLNHGIQISTAKTLTIDLNGAAVGSDCVVDIFTVIAGNVTIKNGMIINELPNKVTSSDAEPEEPTGVYVNGSAANVAVKDIVFLTESDYGTSVYVNGGKATINDCAILNGKSAKDFGIESTVNKNVTGVYVEEGASADINECIIELDNGDCIAVSGIAAINNSYAVTHSSMSSAVLVYDTAQIRINSGYYYGDSALDIYSEGGKAIISEGEFTSKRINDSAIYGSDQNSFGGGITIASGCTTNYSNWKTVKHDHILVYKKLAAPASSSVKMYGYDDIKFSWEAVPEADGYYVYQKKSTNNYAYIGYTKRTYSNRANLYDGYKYIFKVIPYRIINEDFLAKGTKCKGKLSEESNSIYTLKKVTLSSFTSSSGKVKVAWYNIYGESGYQISRSVYSNGTNVVYTYPTTNAKTKLISATKGKKYYYKVRAYKVVNGKRIYAPWSKTKAYVR